MFCFQSQKYSVLSQRLVQKELLDADLDRIRAGPQAPQPTDRQRKIQEMVRNEILEAERQNRK